MLFERTPSVSCPFTGELFALFSLWQAKKLQADKIHATSEKYPKFLPRGIMPYADLGLR
jgi:hypothetical protein